MIDHEKAVTKYGSPVTGDNFMFRQIELKKVMDAVNNNNSFIIFGLRRIGKSSILFEAERMLLIQRPKRPIVMVDAQGCDDPSMLFTKLLHKLPPNLRTGWFKLAENTKRFPQKLINGLKQTFSEGKAFGVGITLRQDIVSYWRSLAEAFQDFLLKIPESERPFLIIDELSFFIENLLEADANNRQIVAEILGTLRSWRNAGIGMGLSGSISIEDQILEIKLSIQLLSNLVRVQIEPLSREEAAIMIQTLAAGDEKWSNEVQTWLLDELPDYFHAFIQLAFFHLSPHPTLDLITRQRVFDHDIWRDLSSILFSQFDERLTKRFRDHERKGAESLMNQLAQTESGILNAREARQTVEKFECDFGFLIEKLIRQDFLLRNTRTGEIQFAFNAVKVWRSNRGMVA